MPSIFMIPVGRRPALSGTSVVTYEPLDLAKPLRAEILQPVEVFFHPGVLRRAVLAEADP